MNTLDVCKRESGKIWHRKLTASGDDGLLLTITNNISSALAVSVRNVRFLHAAFDTSGDSFVAGDYQGGIYLFELNKNRFSLVQRTGSLCTAIAYTMRRKTEFLVAMADYSLKCFDTEAKELVAWMKGHASAINTISIHASGRYAITSSLDTAQLWDLDTFQRKRKLNIKENVGIIKVFFLPMSNTIMTCFKDDSIFAWESDTLHCKFQLTVPQGKPPHFKAFAVTRDGRLLIGGGRSRHLHVWALDTRRMLRIIELPHKITTVRQLEFLPDSFDGGANQALGVLAQDGIMRFLNINTCKLLFDVGTLDNHINSVSISPTGRHLVAVMESGNVHVYSVDALTAELNKPPPPLVKILNGDNSKDSTERSHSINNSKKVRGTARSRTQTGSGKDSQLMDSGTTVDLPEGLSMRRLKSILKGFGEYPAKYRTFIWRAILRLPENHAAYAALVDKGTHPTYEKLHEQYPIKSRKLLRVLQRTMSALAHWSPIFGETDFLPMMAFPFVKLFQNNQLICFEIIATLLVNWCSHWFEYFPNPPINVLGIVENVLAHHDKELLQHLVGHGVTSQTYAWPLLETMFSEVLTRDEWLRVFDNVFTNRPAFLLCLVAAYCTVCRGPLLHCSQSEDFTYFFHHRNAVNVAGVITEAYRMMDTTPDDIHPKHMVDDMNPLTRGQYPVFNKYPRFIVDYQVQERERIRQEELEYLRQQQSAMELQKETERRQAEEEAWYRQQKLLRDAEDKRRKMISIEEQKLSDQRTRLTAMTRELKMKEMQLLDATRRKFLTYQQQSKEAELTRMDDEIRRKAELREMETKAAIDEAEIRNMELHLQKKLFEQELHREFVEADQQQKHEISARRKRHDLEDRVSHNVATAEIDREQQIRKILLQNLAHTDQLTVDGTMKNQLEYRQQLEELNREQAALQKANLQAGNRELQANIHHLMAQVQQKRELEAAARFSELQQQKATGETASARRLGLLEQEVVSAQHHVDNIDQTQDEMFERLRDLKQSLRRPDDSSEGQGFLNDSQDTEISTQLSLDRGRGHLEEKERQLMTEVRNMRSRLARENKTGRPPPPFSAQA